MPVATKMTYADYRAMPEDGNFYQLIEGELIRNLVPNRRHQKILMAVSSALFQWTKANRAGEIYCAPCDVVLSDEDVVQPDVLYVSNERRIILTEEGMTGAPDLCVEILSKSTSTLDRNRKRKLYAKHGVRELWIVDPAWNTVEQYRLQENSEEPIQVLDEKNVLTTNLLPAFELNLAEVLAP